MPSALLSGRANVSCSAILLRVLAVPSPSFCCRYRGLLDRWNHAFCSSNPSLHRCDCTISGSSLAYIVQMSCSMLTALMSFPSLIKFLRHPGREGSTTDLSLRPLPSCSKRARLAYCLYISPLALASSQGTARSRGCRTVFVCPSISLGLCPRCSATDVSYPYFSYVGQEEVGRTRD